MRLAKAFDPARQQSVVALAPLVNRVVDRLRLPVCPSAADHEVIRVSDHPAQVQLHDLERLAVRRVLGDSERKLFGRQR